VFLEHLESEVAQVWSRAMRVVLLLERSLLLLDVDCVDHTEEVGVNLTERDQIPTGELLGQAEEHIVTWDDFSALPLGGTELEAFGSCDGSLLLLFCPREEVTEARGDWLLEEDF